MGKTAVIRHKLSELVQFHTMFRESKVLLEFHRDLFTMPPQLKVSVLTVRIVILIHV